MKRVKIMTGKQRRRLNRLKVTKRQRKMNWLWNKTIDEAWKYLNIPDPIDHNIIRAEVTTKGIIPWIIEQQQKEKKSV